MRAAATSGGLRGEVRTHFPDGVKQQGRDLALTDTCDILALLTDDDGAGVHRKSWVVVEAGVPARLDAMSGRHDEVAGEQLSEAPTHVLSVPAGTDLTGTARVAVQGLTWAVTAVLTRSDAPLLQAEVRVAT